MFFKDTTTDDGKHSSRQNLVGGERMGFSRHVLFFFLHGLGALGSEILAPALGHREASRMVSSFSLFKRNKTPSSFVHHYLYIKYIKIFICIIIILIQPSFKIENKSLQLNEKPSG